MRQTLLDGVKVVLIGSVVWTAVICMLSFGLTGRLPPVRISETIFPSTDCRVHMPTFERALHMFMESLRSPQAAEVWMERWILPVAAVNKTFLAHFYTAALDNNPNLICVVEFLRHKDVSVPVLNAPSMLAHLYFAQRGWTQELSSLGGYF